MATTTNFGWETPDDTDLVKDGALAIRTLGSAIDTSLVDLKGGTTGQVLSKTSNTDMDFTWVTSDDANAIQNAIVDAKGDLIAASAADTPARLAVGNNGETLVADSSATTGLRWNPTTAAGKNVCINGAFDIWQRGTTFTNPSSAGIYTADRWVVYYNGNGTATRETSVKPDTSTYSYKVTATASSAGNDIYQLVEELNMEHLRGKDVTISVKVAGTVGLTPYIQLAYSTTANDTLLNTGTVITPTVIANPAINASTFVTYISRFSVPTTAKTLRIGLITGSMVNTNVVYWAEAQLELGSTATSFSRAGGTLAGEYLACARYYQKSYNLATAPGTDTNDGLNYSAWSQAATTTGYLSYEIVYPVRMRTAATVVTYDVADASGKISRVTPAGTDQNGLTPNTAFGNEARILIQSSSGNSHSGLALHWTASAEL